MFIQQQAIRVYKSTLNDASTSAGMIPKHTRSVTGISKSGLKCCTSTFPYHDTTGWPDDFALVASRGAIRLVSFQPGEIPR